MRMWSCNGNVILITNTSVGSVITNVAYLVDATELEKFRNCIGQASGCGCNLWCQYSLTP